MDHKAIREMIEPGLHLVPPHMHDAVIGYFVLGYQPGGFMTALLSNDLMGALGKADSENAAAIKDWATFLYNYVPSGSYGSPEKMRDWLAQFDEAMPADELAPVEPEIA